MNTQTRFSKLVLGAACAASLALLYGCGPALVAGAAGGSVLAKDPRPTAVVVQDRALETKAMDTLYADPEVARQIHVNVNCYNGVVLLTGEVLSSALATQVVTQVQKLGGVKQIYNEMAVADLTPLKSRAGDGWITSKVKGRMAVTEGFYSTYVNVNTERGVVYLLGLVTQDQGTKAADIARNIEGVEKVVKLFEYTD